MSLAIAGFCRVLPRTRHGFLGTRVCLHPVPRDPRFRAVPWTDRYPGLAPARELPLHVEEGVPTGSARHQLGCAPQMPSRGRGVGPGHPWHCRGHWPGKGIGKRRSRQANHFCREGRPWLIGYQRGRDGRWDGTFTLGVGVLIRPGLGPFLVLHAGAGSMKESTAEGTLDLESLCRWAWRYRGAWIISESQTETPRNFSFGGPNISLSGRRGNRRGS